MLHDSGSICMEVDLKNAIAPGLPPGRVKARDRGGPDACASVLGPSHPGDTTTLRRPAGAAGPSPAVAACGHAAVAGFSGGPASACATGVGLRVEGLGFGVWDVGFKVQCSVFSV